MFARSRLPAPLRGRAWALQTNCTAEVMRCGYLEGGDEAAAKASGCVVCL
ncbi:MAG: hypothetical protein U0168_18840 [Nannocystaceae bacterium]